MTIEKPWIRAQRRVILKSITNRYGEQWRTAFSPAVQRAVIEAEVLNLVLTQALEKYAPAQELARAVLTEPDQLWPALIDEGGKQ